MPSIRFVVLVGAVWAVAIGDGAASRGSHASPRAAALPEPVAPAVPTPQPGRAPSWRV